MRKLPILAFASFVILIVPRVASAQARILPPHTFSDSPQCFFAFNVPGCVSKARTSLPMKGVTFGPARFVKPAAVGVVGFAARGAHAQHVGSGSMLPKAHQIDCYGPTIVAPTYRAIGLPLTIPCARK